MNMTECDLCGKSYLHINKHRGRAVCKRRSVKRASAERRALYWEAYDAAKRGGGEPISDYGARIFDEVGIPVMRVLHSLFAPREMVDVFRLIRSRAFSRKKRIRQLKQAYTDAEYREALAVELSINKSKMAYPRA